MGIFDDLRSVVLKRWFCAAPAPRRSLPFGDCAGRPCSPGMMARSISVGILSRVRSTFFSGVDGLPLASDQCPTRTTQRQLCVVVVTTSAIPTGLGCCPPTTRPAMCEISASKNAPHRHRQYHAAFANHRYADTPWHRRVVLAVFHRHRPNRLIVQIPVLPVWLH